jgi:hypothetical protein
MGTNPGFPEEDIHIVRLVNALLADMACPGKIAHLSHRHLKSAQLEKPNIATYKWERIYNQIRPHQAPGYLTPAEYFD